MPSETTAQSSAVDLAERFSGRVRAFAARRLGDVSAAEDAAQESLRRVLEAIQGGRLRNPETLPAFVFQTARHVCQLRLRGMARQRRAMTRLAGGAETSSADDPLTELVGRERRAALRKAMARLAAADRELLAMLYLEGSEMAVVAARLRLQPGALRVRKHRALRRLGALLGESGWGELD